MRRRLIVLCCTAGFLASLSADRSLNALPTSSTKKPTPVVTKADSDEVALGAALLVQFDSARGVAATPQSRRIEAYLQRVADSLGRYTARKLPWHIHFDPHPAIKSGFALPGGHIVIWGGVLAYMSTEDEVAAIIAHEMEHTELGQVAHRIDSLTKAGHRDLRVPAQWSWREFGATYGETLENLCDYHGAKLTVKANYSPLGLKMLLESYIALGKVHAPTAPPSRVISERIAQIDKEIVDEHWDALTTTRPIRIP
ncbi:MAG: M48 family metallopeptidase [Gemmatimonadota bacterium]